MDIESLDRDDGLRARLETTRTIAEVGMKDDATRLSLVCVRERRNGL
jgi:hypothetical protein